jgi:hypothetical protein
MTVDAVRVLPDDTAHELLTNTLERVNRVSNLARADALNRQVFAGTELRDVVKEHVEKGKLPDGFITPITQRVQSSLERRAGKQPKFSTFQSLTLPAGAYKWGEGKVTMLTARGKRTIGVRVDLSQGGLRHPLEGRPVSIVFRNGEFDLCAADVERPSDDD